MREEPLRPLRKIHATSLEQHYDTLSLASCESKGEDPFIVPLSCALVFLLPAISFLLCPMPYALCPYLVCYPCVFCAQTAFTSF